MEVIKAVGVSKHYSVYQSDIAKGEVKPSFWRRKKRVVEAVSDVDISILSGEVVGFVGDNGAGKTTMMKMLSGIITPSHGSLSVLGSVPANREPEFLRRISFMAGQKQQLSWDLCPLDSFLLNKSIYRISNNDFIRRRDQLIDCMRLGDVVDRPVRKLSLGERMKSEIVLALLHRPEVLFLDEPTIGLDQDMQVAVREFLREYCVREAATVMITSHCTEDISSLCSRVLTMARGRVVENQASIARGGRLAEHSND
jgi:ABC-2 type transport system ATP-binding protein